MNKKGPSRQIKLLQRLLRRWHLITTGAALTLGCTLVTAYIGKLTGMFMDAAKSGNGSDMSRVVLLLVLVNIPYSIFLYGQSYFVESAVNRVAADLRNEIYRHLQSLSLSFFEKNRTGQLMSRMMNDVGMVQGSAGSLVDFISSPLTIIVLVGIMFYVQWKLALVMVVFAPVMGFIIDRIGKRLKRLTTSMQVKVADVTMVLEETIAGVRIVKSFGMEEHETERFEEQNQQSYRAAVRTVKRKAAVTPIISFIGIVAVGAVILSGGYLISQHELTFGQLGQFGFYAFYVSSAAKSLGRLNSTYQQTMAAADRIFELLEEESDVKDKPDAAEMGRCVGLIDFDRVSFGYLEGESVLKDVSFNIEPGQVVAVVGPSGAGKSTIANLIPRFYDVTGGAVRVDGSDIRDVTMASLRANIGIVPQETILFGGTIRSNIAYGDPTASDERIEEAARAANAHDFITKMDEGYDTIIGERGTRLSGGERQRIAIARALLKDPRILILDEATSSLDSTSESVVQAALETLMRGRSTLVIAHRLSTITNADKIIVLADGKIAESGTFTELMEMEGIFARLYRLQFKEEEPVVLSEPTEMDSAGRS